MYNGATDTLTYDALNRLTTYSDTRNNSEQYVYDASGNRILKRSTSAGTTTVSVYPSSNEEYDYSSTGTLTSQLHYYTLAGNLIASFDGTDTTYYLTDALGSVLMSFNKSAVLGEQIYGPYGNTRYTAGTINTAKGYTGQIQDAVTGLDYYNARYYDPVTGMFLSVDSVQGNQLGFDPYAYVSDNPETMTDPTGHLGWGDAAAVGVTAVALLDPLVEVRGAIGMLGVAINQAVTGQPASASDYEHAYTVRAIYGVLAVPTVVLGAVALACTGPVALGLGVATLATGAVTGITANDWSGYFNNWATPLDDWVNNGVQGLPGDFNAVGNWFQDQWNFLMSCSGCPSSGTYAAGMIPNEQSTAEFQQQQDDEQSAKDMHMSVKQYQSWSHKLAVATTKYRDTMRHNYASQYQGYLTSLQGNSANLTVTQIDARMDEWRGAYNAMMDA